MHLLRIVVVAAALVATQLPGAAQGGDAPVTGELVILKGTVNRFRIVDHEGSFTAPAGVSLEAFDGKAVEVDLGKDGQVLQIREKAIAIAPIESTIETITGQLIVVDDATRAFSISGNPRVFIAPEGIDVQTFAGKMVKLRLNERGEVTTLRLASP